MNKMNTDTQTKTVLFYPALSEANIFKLYKSSVLTNGMSLLHKSNFIIASTEVNLLNLQC